MFNQTNLNTVSVSSGYSNKVLSDTYKLLAFSMLPTVAGAWLGVSTGLFMNMTGWITSLIFFIGAFAFMFAIEKNKNSGTGVVILLAFTFFMGLMLSRLIGAVLGFSNGASLIMTAFLGTAAILGGMSFWATTIKRDISFMGKFLFVGAVMLLVACIVNIFLQSTMLMVMLSALMVGLFSAFILYDVKRIIDGGETNYITATLSLYLNVYNIFQGLLSLLGIFGGERD